MGKTFLLLFIALVLSLGFCNTTIAKEKKVSKKEKAASTAKERIDSPLVVNFDINTERLPVNYEGTDIVKLYSMLAKKVPLKKDEFATTDEYEKKKASAISSITGDIYAFKLNDLEAEIAKLSPSALLWQTTNSRKIIGNIKYPPEDWNTEVDKIQAAASKKTEKLEEQKELLLKGARTIMEPIATISYIPAIEITPYNADLKQFEVKIFPSPLINSVDYGFIFKESSSTDSYIGENAFGAKRSVARTSGTQYGIAVGGRYKLPIKNSQIIIPADLDKAKTLKNNIGILFICKPALRSYKQLDYRATGDAGNDLFFTERSSTKATTDDPHEWSFDVNYINVEVLAVWAYDVRTGEILLKKQLKDAKQVSYTDNGNGTITDNVTGLMWQKQDDNTRRTWATAGTYCNSLTLGEQSGWRLPSKKELITIIDYSIPYPGPTINTTYFPHTYADVYWSSTTNANYTIHAWVVVFNNGNVITYSKSSSNYVRCVRGGQ